MKRILSLILTSALVLTSCGVEEGPVFSSMVQGGEWFLNNQNDEFLEYVYDPITNEYSEEDSISVVHIRKMASWWVISELGEYTDNDELRALSRKGYELYVPMIEDSVVHINKTKDPIAFNAFAILALLEMGDEEELAMELADALLTQQEESGRLNTFFGKVTESNTDYYPGEALLALMRLYDATGETRYKAAVSLAFEYYALDYWPENENTAFVPWQTQAYFLYYLETHDPRVLDFIYDMNDYLVDRYASDESCNSFEFAGGVTAVHLEGMNKAYRLAHALEDEARSHCYGQFIVQGLDFTMSLQYPQDGVDPSTLPIASLGGFMATSSNHEMRVDRNQHAIMALLGSLELELPEPVGTE